MIGSTQGAISKIIKGEIQKPRNILDIANAFGVDTNWLQYGGERSVSLLSHNKFNNNNAGSTTNNYYGNKSDDNSGNGFSDLDRFARQLDRLEQKVDFLVQQLAKLAN